MNIDDDITMTPVGSGASMGMHESQSRFYENIIGRSEEFWKPVYPRLQTFFADNLEEVSLEQFVQGINKVEASLIRTEADEPYISIAYYDSLRIRKENVCRRS